MSAALPEESEPCAAEDDRRDAREVFEAAFADAPAGVALIGLDGRFLRVNTAVCEMLGRSSPELIGNRTENYCHPDDVAATRGAYANLGNSSEPVSIEKRYVRPVLDALTASDEEALEQADKAMYRDKAVQPSIERPAPSRASSRHSRAPAAVSDRV